MNTLFSYDYRDGAGYKTRHSEILVGTLTLAQIEDCLERGVCDDTGFIPGQVGLRDLQQQLADECQCLITANDHVWHSIVEITPTEKYPTSPMTAEACVNAFRKAKGDWQVMTACERMGLDLW